MRRAIFSGVPVRRRSEVLWPLLLSLLIAGSRGCNDIKVGGPTSVDKNAEARQEWLQMGKTLYDELHERWRTLGGEDDIRQKSEFDRQVKLSEIVLGGLDEEQSKDLAIYIGMSRRKIKGDFFCSRVQTAILRCVMLHGMESDIVYVLSQVYQENLDGVFLEWALERETGHSVSILCTAYFATVD